jgi:hypothetical protein
MNDFVFTIEILERLYIQRDFTKAIHSIVPSDFAGSNIHVLYFYVTSIPTYDVLN